MAQVTPEESCRESLNDLFLNQITQATEMLDQSQGNNNKKLNLMLLHAALLANQSKRTPLKRSSLLFP